MTGGEVQALVGMDEATAQQIVLSKGFTFRVTGRDGVSFPATMDFRDNRVNVSIEKGKVISANIG